MCNVNDANTQGNVQEREERSWVERNLDRDPLTGERITPQWIINDFATAVGEIVSACHIKLDQTRWQLSKLATVAVDQVPGSLSVEVMREAAGVQVLPSLRLPIDKPHLLPFIDHVVWEFCRLQLEVARAEKLLSEWEDLHQCFRGNLPSIDDDVFRARLEEWIEFDSWAARRMEACMISVDELMAVMQDVEE